MSAAPVRYRRRRDSRVDDFEPIGQAADVPMTLIGNAGLGAASHLGGLPLMSALVANMTTLSDKGTGAAMHGLPAGTLDLICEQTTNTVSQIKACGVTASKWVPSLCGLPTPREQGLTNFQVVVWHRLYAPTGTPKPLVDKLTEALQIALKETRTS